MKAKHIPGPWEVMKPGEGGNEGPNLEIHDPYGRTATVYGELDAENYATANLIAAAPDLIAVLERIVQLSREGEGDRLEFSAMARAALMKVASGRSA